MTPAGAMLRLASLPTGSPLRAITAKHPELFHYTTARGLEGILTSQTIWATHVSFLNDTSEMIEFANRLPEILSPIIQTILESMAPVPGREAMIEQAGGKAGTVKSLVDNTISTIYGFIAQDPRRPPDVDAYAASFATTNDDHISAHGLLSQWRGYGTDGGYAVVLDTAALSDLFEEEAPRKTWGLFGGDVLYSNATLEQIRSGFPDVINVVDACIKRLMTADNPPLADIGTLIFNLLSCACRYKHRGFEEEREVRVVGILTRDIPGTPPSNVSVHSYLRGGTVVPAIHFFEGLTEPKKRSLPIRRIIVGPHKDKELRKHSVELLLRQNRLLCPVTISEIPYITHG